MVQVKKAEVREAILDAAAQLFVEKGYAGTSANEIGQRAGVAASAIYAKNGSASWRRMVRRSGRPKVVRAAVPGP